MHVRMIPKSTPDTKFADVATHQPEYSRDNVAGTIVGFWRQRFSMGLVWQATICTSFQMIWPSVVMSWTLSSRKALLRVGAVDQLDQRFPVQDRQYLFAKFNVDEMKKNIEKAE